MRVDSLNQIDSITISDGLYSIWNNGNISYQNDINNLDNMSLGDCHLGVFNDALEYGSVLDNEGNSYRTISIGNQLWMAENLKTAHFNNGDPVEVIIEDALWSSATGSACCSVFNNDNYDCPYGKLYNQYTVLDPRGVCPSGFHIPTQADWDALVLYCDPSASLGWGNQSNVAGAFLKSVGNLNWADNLTGTNSTGFSAVGSADRYLGFGWMDNFNDYCGFYESTGFYRTLAGWGPQLDRWYPGSPTFGYSIRCIQD